MAAGSEAQQDHDQITGAKDSWERGDGETRGEGILFAGSVHQAARTLRVTQPPSRRGFLEVSWLLPSASAARRAGEMNPRTCAVCGPGSRGPPLACVVWG